MSRVAGIMAGVVIVVLLLVGGWLLLNHVIELRLLASLGQAMKADVHCGSLSLNPLAGRLEAREVTFRSTSSGSIWQQARAGTVVATFQLSQLFSSVTPVKIEIKQAQLSFQTPSALAEEETGAPSPGTAESMESTGTRWPRLIVREITVHHLDLDAGDRNGDVTARDLTALAEHPAEDAWQGSVSGAINLHGVEFATMSVDFATGARGVDVPEFKLTDPASGGSISGRVHLPEDHPEAAVVHFDLHRMPLNLLIPARWQMILSGKATGSGDYTGSFTDWRQGTAQLRLTLEEPRLETLPFVQGLSGFPGLGALSGISLDTASADVAYDHGAFALNHVILTRQGTVSLLGQADVASSGTLDGTFQFGLPPSALALAPVLKDKIFNSEHDGFDWAQVKLSGTPGQWTEDLSPRVTAVAPEQAAQWLQQGQGALDKGVKKASDFLNGLLK